MAVNQLISTNLAAIATFENERRKDRQRQGIQIAKKNGKYFGRKTVIDKKLISQVQDLKENITKYKLSIYIMKAVFKKIARVKKRKAIKRAILVVVTAYLLKYSLINETTDLFIYSF